MSHSKKLLVIGSESHYGRNVVTGIHRFCSEHGRWDYYLGRDNSPEATDRAEIAINEWKADGIIAHIITERVERLVQNAHVPVICVNAARSVNLPTVITDNIAVGRMAAKHFLNLGFRNFAFNAVRQELATIHRAEGFVSELAAAGFSCDVWTDHHEDHAENSWWRNFQKREAWLKSLKKPVGMLCAYDTRGQEIAMACKRLGLRSPEDVAVVGVGNDEILCLTSDPRLSSIELDIQRIGYEAARLLDRLIRGGQPPRKPVLIPPIRVVTRQSSEIVAFDDPVMAEALKSIRDHASQPFNVGELIQQMAVSRRFLEKRFRQHLGRTPAEEIMRVRIDRAKMLLRDTDLPIPAVARGSGFAGREIFAAVFRREASTTPGKFRRRSRLIAHKV